MIFECDSIQDVQEWLYENSEIQNLRILESLLSTGLHSLYTRYKKISNALKPLLPLQHKGLNGAESLSLLLPLKNDLDSLSKLLRDVENCLLEVLREDVGSLCGSLGDTRGEMFKIERKLIF